LGKLLVVVGLVIAAIGVLMIVGVPFGRMPGDVVYRRDNATFYFPLVTSIVLSVLVSLLLALFRR
jgi:Protein of unknown function (DUF2905)